MKHKRVSSLMRKFASAAVVTQLALSAETNAYLPVWAMPDGSPTVEFYEVGVTGSGGGYTLYKILDPEYFETAPPSVINDCYNDNFCDVGGREHEMDMRCSGLYDPVTFPPPGAQTNPVRCTKFDFPNATQVQVRAANAQGRSGWATKTIGTPPPPPTEITQIENDDPRLVLRVNPSADDSFNTARKNQAASSNPNRIGHLDQSNRNLRPEVTTVQGDTGFEFSEGQFLNIPLNSADLVNKNFTIFLVVQLDQNQDPSPQSRHNFIVGGGDYISSDDGPFVALYAGSDGMMDTFLDVSGGRGSAAQAISTGGQKMVLTLDINGSQKMTFTGTQLLRHMSIRARDLAKTNTGPMTLGGEEGDPTMSMNGMVYEMLIYIEDPLTGEALSENEMMVIQQELETTHGVSPQASAAPPSQEDRVAPERLALQALSPSMG